jgi:5-methylcytosine-specific restriction endonuclease McrA
MKRSRLKPVGKKRAGVLRKEQALKQELASKGGGLCQLCGHPPDFRGLSKHEIVFRSHGGDPTDITNVQLICGKCHSLAHGITENGGEMNKKTVKKTRTPAPGKDEKAPKVVYPERKATKPKWLEEGK